MQYTFTNVPDNIDVRRCVQCTWCQAIVPAMQQEAHIAFHNILEESATNMSNVSWCDPGNHAFKAGDKGSQSFNGTQVDDDGNTVVVKMDACGEHSFWNKPESNTAIAKRVEE